MAQRQGGAYDHAMAHLYLSGGGFGVHSQAWPEALAWLASHRGEIGLASLASDETRQAEMLQATLAARGRIAHLIPLGDAGESYSTIFLCGGDATRLAGDPQRRAALERWLARDDLTLVADSAAAMAMGRRAASCTCGGHPIRVIDGLALLGDWSVLAHASGPDDPRLTELADGQRSDSGRQLALPTGAAVEVLMDNGTVALRSVAWSRVPVRLTARDDSQSGSAA